jgi:hypothetical protein
MTTTGQTEVGRPFPPSECGLTPSDANPNLTCLGSRSNSGQLTPHACEQESQPVTS